MFFLFILESLGSTELLFILVMALVFFGPRKLPQISKSLGKSLAEFRRASDDFKRTWEREVAIESGQTNSIASEPENISTDYSAVEPTVTPLPSEHSISRDLIQPHEESQSENVLDDSNSPEPPRKRDWL